MTQTTQREEILSALDRFVRQRPGLEFGNYGDSKSYNAELRSIGKDRRDAMELLANVGWRESITAADLLDAAKSAYSGRLSISFDDQGQCVLDYCTGQYWPTEYRRAVCAVLSQAIWNATRDDMGNGDVDGQSPGTRIRNQFKREFGLGMAKRWFDYGG
jgi:hypothetical protein